MPAGDYSLGLGFGQKAAVVEGGNVDLVTRNLGDVSGGKMLVCAITIAEAVGEILSGMRGGGVIELEGGISSRPAGLRAFPKSQGEVTGSREELGIGYRKGMGNGASVPEVERGLTIFGSAVGDVFGRSKF